MTSQILKHFSHLLNCGMSSSQLLVKKDVKLASALEDVRVLLGSCLKVNFIFFIKSGSLCMYSVMVLEYDQLTRLVKHDTIL